MVQERQRGQPQSKPAQPPRNHILSGRVSPQNFKRVGPAISEILRASVRTRPHTDVPNGADQPAFRPNSGADAFLYLEEGAETNYRSGSGLDAQKQKQELVDVRRSAIHTSRIALPVGGNSNSKQPPASATASSEKRTLITQRPLRRTRSRQGAHEDTRARRGDRVRIRLPGIIQRQTSGRKGRRVSKALPALPPPSPLPSKVAFNQSQQPAVDVFRNNKDKVLRGHGSPMVAPSLKNVSGNYDSSSGSSYDSAEQTWNMINSMMSAVSEDDIKRARSSLVHGNAQHKIADARAPGAYVTFPRVARPRRDVNTSSESSDYSKESDSFRDPLSSQPRMGRPGGQDPNHFPHTFPRPRSTALTLNRHTSVASVFSIVIQPTREVSHEAQEALVPEDNLPLRIRGILQCTHKHEMAESTPPSRTSSISSDEVDLHPDVMLTIDALRSVSNVELDDIPFDS